MNSSVEIPDLGAFTTVFRALDELQLRTFPAPLITLSTTVPSSTSNFSPTEYDSDTHRGSTVWNHQPIASYLSISSHDVISNFNESPSLPPSEPASSDTEGDPDADVDHNDDPSTLEPSLGYLDQALQFIAAERAKFTAQRDAAWRGNSSTSEGPVRPYVPPRRKRRRKKAKSLVRNVSIVRHEAAEEDSRTETIESPADQEADEWSSSIEISSSSPAYYKSTPATPPQKKKERTTKLVTAVESNRRLSHSKSTPSLRHVSMPLDPRVVRLRALAIKLRFMFPEDATSITSILSNDSLNSSSPISIDPRGPSPLSGQALTHVFIDYSNISIGFLTYLRTHPHHLTTTKPKHISHAALALILERGRSITRRALAASSPLYQPMDSAEQLGYDVRVYARVPDTGDGTDRTRHAEGWKGKGRSGQQIFTKGHAHRVSSGGTSTESEPGSHNSPRPGQPRIRYREQGVDELLQLKLHQAIADVDVPPKGSTIVLATGDGNVGQFNEEGFLGCVRTALKKGWRVELYAWEGGLSRAWLREFGDGSSGGNDLWAGKFRIVPMDAFGADLLEV
ncbi:hypothetical protein EW146_g5600 [Bondarzewia mesenterica]|uniref:NYN domain-containing protein n=1 Tax=Bondarzewia mesenterica TaxID=1095465 RepID=A0A4S4LT37_9AGAM|nr:hypothetical protein EW146_g5600 [Bondarzewia mesenterica]